MKNKVDTLYHGSKKEFKKFDTKFIGTASGTSGAGIGFYFSSEIDEAKNYGNIIYVIKLPELGKEVSNFKRTIPNINLLKIINNIFIESKGEENYYENFDEYTWEDHTKRKNLHIKKDIERAIISGIIGYTDTEIIAGITNSGTVSIQSILEQLCKFDYTHTKDYWENSTYKHSEHFILYFEPKIKQVIKL